MDGSEYDGELVDPYIIDGSEYDGELVDPDIM